MKGLLVRSGHEHHSSFAIDRRDAYIYMALRVK